MNLRRLLLVFVVAGVMLFSPAPRAGATPCAPTASGISVAVVIDFGDGSPVSAVCVPADSSDNGAAVLAARAEQLGTPAPRFDSSGFVCGIDGYPSTGCGDQSGSKYAYWSYWHGTSGGAASWEYSNVGPGGSRVHADVVEGWRFQPQGAGNPTDPPPNGNPDHNATCVPPTTTTTITGPSLTEPAPTTVETAVAPAAAPATVTTVATTGTSSSSSSTITTVASSSSSSSSQAAAAPVRVTEPAKHSSPVPAIGAGVAIVGLIGGGVFFARRRGSA